MPLKRSALLAVSANTALATDNWLSCLPLKRSALLAVSANTALATVPVETEPQNTEVPFEVSTNPLAPSDELATIPPLKKVLPVNVVFAEVVNNVKTPVLAVTAPIPRGACHVAPCKAAELAVLATLN